jgi:hypothetical protein
MWRRRRRRSRKRSRRTKHENYVRIPPIVRIS